MTEISTICLEPFSDEDLIKKATKEDAPPRSLGGSKVTLTCKKCNNTCGTTIDIHLVNFIKQLDRQLFLEGANRKITIYDDNQTLNGFLSIKEGKDLVLEVNAINNDSRKLESIISHWTEDKILEFSNQKLKLNKHNLDIAILKTAYILLFSTFGYSILNWKEYDLIRNQILSPDKVLVPPLWTIQSIDLKDGIYYNNYGWIRGFFVVFSSKNPDTNHSRKFITLLPAPQTDFQIAHYFLNRIKTGDRLQFWPLDNFDFLTDPQNINQLNKWAYGESLRIADKG